jgi:S-DNA-T family DNA segregation ATPase FtsK/SpoIIIE
MAIFGTGGSGKSTVLRTLGIVAGLSTRGGPCHVYALDFGARALRMLEVFDHVGAVVDGSDSERVQRLLGKLRDVVDERSRRYQAVNASNITEYRDQAGRPDEPRILLLVDAIGVFRDEYETGPYARWFDVFQNIAAAGRQVGVHLVVTVERPQALPSALSAFIQRRLVLRQASENEYMSLNVAPDVFGVDSPPGRGVFEGKDVQVLVLGGSSSTQHQADAAEHLAAQLRAADTKRRFTAEPIGRLAERIPLSSLPVFVDSSPTLGVSFDTLVPIGFVTGETLVVTGPPQSGRSSAMATLAQSLVRSGKGRLVYFGGGRSLLSGAVEWAAIATDDDAVTAAAADLSGALAAGDSYDAIFIEDFPAFGDLFVTKALEDLIAMCRKTGVSVIADADTSNVLSSSLYRALLVARHGLVLQPDPFDGENLFKTPLPGRVLRGEFPPGRAFYIRAGRTERVQIAFPDEGGA